MPAHLEVLPPPVDPRIEILEATPEVLEVRFHPPGWKRSMTWGLAVRFALLVGLGVYLAVPLTNIALNIALNNARDVTAIDLLFMAGFGCWYLGALTYYAWDCYRQAEEWTILRIEGRRICIRHPRLFRDNKQLDLRVKRAEKIPTERYSVRHQLLLRAGTKSDVLCFTPLDHPDIRWVIDEINQRIAAPDEGHAGKS